MEFFFERQDVKDGGRVRLPAGTVSIGRSPKSTIVLPAGDRCVSGVHAVVYSDPRRLLLQDMQSTNGTFVNGRRVQECVLEEGDEVRLGRSGPVFRVVGGGGAAGAGEFGFDVDTGASVGFPAGALPAFSEIKNFDIEDEDAEAEDGYPGRLGLDDYAASGLTEKTLVHGGRFRAAHAVIALAVVAFLGFLAFAVLAFASTPASTPSEPKPQSGKRGFFSPPDGETSPLPPTLSPSSNNGMDINTIINADIDDGINNRRQPPSIPTTDRINAILAGFGETADYSAPPEMVERVEHYLAFYTGRNRRTTAAWTERSRRYFPMVRRVFTEKNIPLELAYVSMLESGFDAKAVSHAGAVGLWQFMPHTARRYGLEVSNRIDERTDPEKATYAAAEYFKHLIAIFGAKSSVMLCMAAYNAGEQRIINALKRIDDPMRDRDFWYLYRMGWLAQETNEYIPQIIALIIISENLEEYGF